MIDFYIMPNNYDGVWRGTSIYGCPKFNQKMLTCIMFNNLA